MNKLELILESKYRSIHESSRAPDWAINIEPAIPFVGNNYDKKSVKCLIFGSAENLTYLQSNEITPNNYLRNRQIGGTNEYFKNIHMAPISDGSLLTASRFILAKHGYDNIFSSNPKCFLEEVATVNFGKYSIESSTNVDYASRLKYLKNSFDFVKADLETLDPNIIIIPKTIYNFRTVKNELFTKNRVIIPIYQTNSRVINSHLSKVNMSESIYDYPFVSDWLRNINIDMKKYLSWLTQEVLNT